MGLSAAFEVDLLLPISELTRPGIPYLWWDETSDEGIVMLGAILGCPPASTYSLLIEVDGPVEPAVADPNDRQAGP